MWRLKNVSTRITLLWPNSLTTLLIKPNIQGKTLATGLLRYVAFLEAINKHAKEYLTERNLRTILGLSTNQPELL